VLLYRENETRYAVGTRYGPEQKSRTWDYPTDLDGFLAVLGTSIDDPDEAKVRVEIFTYAPVASRMPIDLRRALRDAGLLEGPIPTGLDGERR
jgi:hypothetical protein